MDVLLIIVGSVFGGSAVLVLGGFGVAATIDVFEIRKKNGAAKRLGKVVRVRVRAIKTPAIRARLEANRSIIHASNEQAIALKQQHDGKRERHSENMARWDQEFLDLAGTKAIEAPAHKETFKKKDFPKKSVKPTIMDDSMTKAQREAIQELLDAKRAERYPKGNHFQGNVWYDE